MPARSSECRSSAIPVRSLRSPRARLDLLQVLSESVLVPPVVAHEIRWSVPDRPAWVVVHSLAAAVPDVVLRRSLGDGERETIGLALQLRADLVIVDDLPARRAARAAGLHVVGTVGLLLGAKRRGLLDRVRPELDSLIKNAFFMSPQLYQRS